MTIYIGEYEKTSHSLVAAEDKKEAERNAIAGEVHCCDGWHDDENDNWVYDKEQDEIEYDGRHYDDGEFLYSIYSIREVPDDLLEGAKFAMA